MGGYGGPGFDWRNPFTAYNCTWGFHSPAPFPEDDAACAPESVQREGLRCARRRALGPRP